MVSEENLKKLACSRNKRTSTIATLSINNNISFAEAEKKFNNIISECLCPTGLKN